jgi:hypothetical protein
VPFRHVFIQLGLCSHVLRPISTAGLWKTKASGEYKLFIWLALQDRCWTSDHLHRHGLRNNGLCSLSSQEVETIDHLLLGCGFTREVWFLLPRSSSRQQFTPAVGTRLLDWWLHSRQRIRKPSRAAFDSFVFLVARSIWSEHNNRVFNARVSSLAPLLAHRIVLLRDGAGLGCLPSRHCC